MKTSTYKYIFLFGITGLLLACSTKKNSFVNRNWHAVTTEYNVLYNGEMALDAGLKELKNTYSDDYWDILPTERMQLTEEEMSPTDAKNPNFERSETKATKAIQKHSMNIANSEKNPQMDEAHLLLGKTRYYDNRFIPALEAFNYILYKHPNSDKIYEAKVWREKTNLRLENEGIAIKNLKKLIKDNKLDDQVYADANATLAQAYINTQHLDSALVALKRAELATKEKEEVARYKFIKGQIYDKLSHKDSAFAAYQEVIDMKRKSPRRYVIQAHAMQAAQFDFAKGDTLAFMKKYNELLKDRENRPHLDVLNHQVALFYDKQNNNPQAIKYYNMSLRTNSKDRYLMASNHRNMAEMNFEQARYAIAGMYYDSTLVYLNNRTREYKTIKKKRDNLADVIKYEGIAQTNDSILSIVALPEAARKQFFIDYIEKLKKQEELAQIRAEEQARREITMMPGSDNGLQNNAMQPMAGGRSGEAGLQKAGTAASGTSRSDVLKQETTKNRQAASDNLGAPSAPVGNSFGGNSKFYFYNAATVAFGKIEFKKRWGSRALTENWRWSAEQRNRSNAGEAVDETADAGNAEARENGEKPAEAKYNPDFYLSQLPTSQKVLDSLAKERNFAYYQLGTIYKEKFKEYQRAADKLEKLLVNNPEERLVLPAKYNLYKIYEIIDPAKAEKYKQQILTQYPDSRYAEIIRNPASENMNAGSPEAVYAALYKRYEKGEVREVLKQSEEYIETYTGEDIVTKFEMLKATAAGRLKGIEEYRQGLNFVALNYPNSSEGKEAESLLKTSIPNLEKLTFGQPSGSWKVIYKFEPGSAKIKPLKDKLAKFIKEGLNNSIILTEDIYTENENFVVVHGFNSKIAAIDAITVLKDYKAYKVTETPIIIATEDYKVVQIKKNLTQYTAIK